MTPSWLTTSWRHHLNRILRSLINHAPSCMMLQRCHLLEAHWIDVIDMDNLFIRNCYNQLIISFINNQPTLHPGILFTNSSQVWSRDLQVSSGVSNLPPPEPSIPLALESWCSRVFPPLTNLQSPSSMQVHRFESVAAAAPTGIGTAVSFHEPLLCSGISEKKRGSILNFRRWTSWLKTEEEERDDMVNGTPFMRM